MARQQSYEETTKEETVVQGCFTLQKSRLRANRDELLALLMVRFCCIYYYNIAEIMTGYVVWKLLLEHKWVEEKERIVVSV